MKGGKPKEQRSHNENADADIEQKGHSSPDGGANRGESAGGDCQAKSAGQGRPPRRAHQRMVAEPQVKPPPKASSSTRFPGWMRPPRAASSRAMAVEAAEVFPYFSMLQ